MRQSGKETKMERMARDLLAPERREGQALSGAEEFAEELAPGARSASYRGRKPLRPDRD